jgi:hypothetical protein
MKTCLFVLCLLGVSSPLLLAAGKNALLTAPLSHASLIEQLSTALPLLPTHAQEAKAQRARDKEDQLYRAYSELQKNHRQLSASQRHAAIRELLARATRTDQSPLLPYIYYLVYQLAEDYSPHYPVVASYFNKASTKDTSCPYFYFMNDQVTGSPSFFSQAQRMQTYVRELQTIGNKALQYRLILNFLSTMARKKQAHFFPNLAWIGRSYPPLRKRFPWLVDPEEQKETVAPGLAAAVQQANKAKGCAAGKKKLLASLTRKKADLASFEHFMSAAEKIDICVRPNGATARLGFWRSLNKPVDKAYGFKGWAPLQLKQARLLWNEEHNELAKKICTKIINLSGKKRSPDTAARAAYLYALILQNEHNLRGAVRHFERFLARFPSHVHANDARQALLLLYAERKLWPQVYRLCADSIAGLEKRSLYFDKAIASSFYFWQARAAQLMGKNAEAQRNWQILADTYFGTYYGALGHYLLETSLHTEIPLQPLRQIPVDRHILVDAFNPISRERQKVDLVMELLELGKTEDASCEISLMSFEGKSPEQQVAHALLLHISGEWLEAVRVYQRLPDEVRQNLPISLEKIFYPKKYEDEIIDYSQRLALDPDFVFSLIRQESVFNPMAHSPVGAKGLMQMMNDTARRESQKLSPDYLPSTQRAEIVRKTQFPSALFDVDTNLALGVHHLKTLESQFPNPILILAAYNAGPAAAQKWQTRLVQDDMLVFIEKIPYQETRNYVKYILRNYFYYKRLYPSENETYPLLSFLSSS